MKKNYKSLAALLNTLIVTLLLSLFTNFSPYLTSNFVYASTTNYTQSSSTYPLQTVKISTTNGRTLNISGISSNSPLNTWTPNGEENENWYLNFISDSTFEIVNMKANMVISVENSNVVSGSKCVISEDKNALSQQWVITGVDKDFLGNYLYYKITNKSNPDLALTYNPTTNSILLSRYTSSTSQKWKLNCDGLEGFAANCNTEKGEKAGTLGGTLGETVFVKNLAEFKNALLQTKPLTIVITANIDNCNDEMYDLRIASNKTIIGSYNAKRLTDPRLRTDDYFKKEPVSNNIILKNLNIEVKNREDVEALAVYGSDNIWIDHCTFNGSLKLYYDEVGKFIWVNRSEYASDDPDFVTISYNKFSNRFWGIAFGGSDKTKDRASVMYNSFDSIVQRAPHLGNGSLHVYNNYYVRNRATLYNDGYASIKGGEGSQVYSQGNRFENYQKESSGYWDNEFEIDKNATCTDIDSYTNRGVTPVNTPYKISVSANPSTWCPNSNYGYSILNAFGSNDVKAFCQTYSGAVTSYSKLKYINSPDCSKYVIKKVNSPLKAVTPEYKEDSGLVDSGVYMIKNASSNLYLEVAGGKAENTANVQQWGANGAASHNTWKLVSAGNGYYYLYSQLSNGNTFLLDVDCGKQNNGTNIQIFQNTNSDAQLFKIVENSNGTFSILTKVTNAASAIEVTDGSKTSGANVQQWGNTNGLWQQWIFEKVK